MMSKMISRRVFLKATGLAVLSATAAGALAGCGGGGAPSTASPTMDGSKQQGMGDIYVNMGSFVPMTFNNDYYKYTFLYIDNKANNTSFELNLSDFTTCTVDGIPATVCSLDNIVKDGALHFTTTASVGPSANKSIPLYIKLTAEQYRNDNKTVIVFTSASQNKKATFTYEAASIYPDILIEEA